MSYIHITNKSAYSLSWGAMHPKELVKVAAEQQMPALGISDRFNFFCALEFSLLCKEYGIQPIIGIDINYIADIEQKAWGIITLIAQNEQAYIRLSHLISDCYARTEHAPLMIDGPYITQDDLNNMEGVIALAGYDKGIIGHYLALNQQDKAQEYIQNMQSIFGDRLYMDITRHQTNKQYQIEQRYIALADGHNVPLLASNDCHFIKQDFYEAHEILLCIQAQTTLDDPKHPHLSTEHYFKNSTQMQELFADLPDALNNTVELAKRCHFMVQTRAPILPSFAKTTKAEGKKLHDIAFQGLQKRMQQYQITDDNDVKDYNARAEYELNIITKMGYAGYFLIVADFIEYAKNNNIPVGPGRGSGAGSIIAWALNITDLNPMRFGLLFERFLNPERVSMPDFDIDFCQDKRQQIIEYVQQKYGQSQVAQIITFGSLQAKGAIRDVGRVLGMPYGQVDKISKFIPFRLMNGKPVTIANVLESDASFKEAYNGDEAVKILIDYAMRLEGLLRNASTHAAGIVISGDNLANLVPLYRDPRSALPVTQYNMKFVEQAGLVKFDFLGLKTLSMIELTLDYIQKTKSERIDINNINLDDEKTYNLLQSGNALGVFQFESSGMRDVLRQMKPDSFTDLIAAVALYRPGPMENIPTYIKRKHGLEEVTYPHQVLKEVLSETYGIPIYQEQVMQIAQLLSGYTLGGADLLRRAMGKKNKEEMQVQQDIFIKGAWEKHQLPEEDAKNIFSTVEAFAGYGFNKSHAAAYALISYQTAYLKAHYPYEFLAASLTYEMDNPDKIKLFIDEAKRLNVNILPVDINHSAPNFDIKMNAQQQPCAIYYALSAIKNISDKAIHDIVAIRNKNGPFTDIWNMCHRINPKLLNKKMIEHLGSCWRV